MAKPRYKTPGVYIEEIKTLPKSVAEVETAIPAFIGYTEKAEKKSKSILNKPQRIYSLLEFENYFGKAPKYAFELSRVSGTGTPDFEANGEGYQLQREDEKFRMHEAIRFFYDNGGAKCYVVSVGDYADGIDPGRIAGSNNNAPDGGIQSLRSVSDPTMVLAPDAVSLDASDCYDVYREMAEHCSLMKDRVAILDVHDGFDDFRSPSQSVDVIESFRNQIGSRGLKNLAAYYPWVQSTLIETSELSLDNLTESSLEVLQRMLMKELGIDVHKQYEQGTRENSIADLLRSILVYRNAEISSRQLHKALHSLSSGYGEMLRSMADQLNQQPVAPAMAGVYTSVDALRGVWKAPANVSLASTIRPLVNIDHRAQEDLNVTQSGKSINAIRAFVGKGVLVWGARTLVGNDNEWRYINVRRTIIMIEESIKNSTEWVVFEPNDANTWSAIKMMVENYLQQKWRQGTLAGTKPEDAFFVNVGLGSTMTAQDILMGRMIIEIGMAIVRPAEFMIVRIVQQMPEK